MKLNPQSRTLCLKLQQPPEDEEIVEVEDSVEVEDEAVVVEIRMDKIKIKTSHRRVQNTLTCQLVMCPVTALCISAGGALHFSVQTRVHAPGRMYLQAKVNKNEPGTSPLHLINLTICTRKFRKYKLFTLVKSKNNLSLSHLLKKGGVNLYKSRQ